jgi:hypothetical protein
MISVLTSDRGGDDLKRITTYEWDDDGAAAGARFTWIGADTSDSEASAQAAAVLTEFLLVNHSALMTVDSGFLGLSKTSAAQLNPVLIRSYAQALAPHLGELVGGHQSAFDVVRADIAGTPLALRNLLSVFVADPEAGRTIVEAAHVAAEQYQHDAATAPPGSDEAVAALTAAGALMGAAYGAVDLAGAHIPTPASGDAANEMAMRVAAALVPVDPNPAKVSTYVQDGRLMTPAEVENKYSTAALQTYFLDLGDYVSDKGFGEGMAAFHDAFMAHAGVPSP